MGIAMTSVHGQAGKSIPAGQAGRLREEGLSSFDRNYGLWMHLSILVGVIVVGPLAPIAPIVMWACRRDLSGFIDDHGREIVNLILTGLVVSFVLVWLPIIGWLAMIIWYVIAAVGTVRGAIAANSGEYFRYPMVIRFLA